ncbi:MAG: DNA-binding protein [Novosphingobium sp. 16-62-11]|uniref:hemolysin family protein n=1 Tax=Novosphingobium sp. 17-62-19 TaxID=1970406 RepID=UPI000BDC14B7|nr:hemolysin family protein [Novosphingobium sp. 17-62-19]OYX93660.1 MAG: DNA-binding protein [Novosphingobium sp. 35-62-5]OYZ46202.1 MAG: DNA-binding protein [Novosphingobium sp. 16-62-11]OZA17355.1 MAG: DNA-binding protein [Novosphingobium sp. 17-62-19]HQS97437.1 hemolysin family protein [Novosphingobium sp.]
MTPYPWSDVLFILGLVVLNGLFSMSELAIVSARPARLRVAAEEGSKGAKTALLLSSDPGKFLSTVQIGITLVAIISGAYSGASLGGPTAERFAAWGFPARYADDAGFAIVIAITTYLSLVVGELVPKQLALRAAEPIAKIAAPAMALMSKVMAPFVWLLDSSSSLIIRLLGLKKGNDQEVTAEELHMIFAEATRSGVIEEEERALMSGIMRLAERPVREVMTPRTELHWIERRAPETELRAAIEDSPHSLLLVADGSVDRIVGVVKVRDVLSTLLRGRKVQLGRLMKKPVIVPDQLDTMDALSMIQQAEVAMALVHDEYGHLEGIVTPADLLAAIAGNFVGHGDAGDGPMVVEREDGSLLIAGAFPADALADRLGIDMPDDREFATTAGFCLSVLKRLPNEGEHFTDQGWRFEVVDMDGRKIDKLLVSKKKAMPMVEPEGDG